MTALAADRSHVSECCSRAARLLIAVICLTLAYALLTTYYGLVYSAIQAGSTEPAGATMAIYFMAMYMCWRLVGPLPPAGSAI